MAKKFSEMNEIELQSEKRSLNLKLNEIYDKAEVRELTDDEKKEERELTSKLERVNRCLDDIIRQRGLDASRPKQAEKAVGEYIREILQAARNGKNAREITLFSVSGNPKGSITESGAINLDINDLIPTLQEGLDLPKGMNIVTGVVGDTLVPYGIDDAKIVELVRLPS